MATLEKRILLSRPHSYIAEEMKNTLIRNGFTPFSITNLEEIKTINPLGLKGIIISTSNVSTVEKSYDETFKTIRNQFSEVPVLFTTLPPPGKMAPMIENVLNHLIPGTKVLVFDTEILTHPTLGSKQTVILLGKSDLVDSNKVSFIDRFLQSYFK